MVVFFRCKQCNFSTVNRKEMYQHAHKHTAGKSKHLCESCGQCFTSKLTLQRHSLQHKNMKMLSEQKEKCEAHNIVICERCGETVLGNTELNNHGCSI